MTTLRRIKGLLPLLATLAMIANLALAACCTTGTGSGAPASRQIYDSVLGWVSICAPSKMASSGTGDGGRHGHTAACAHMCAAAAAFAVAFFFSLLSVLSPQRLTLVPVRSARQTDRSRLLYGGLGSRAPPSLRV